MTEVSVSDEPLSELMSRVRADIRVIDAYVKRLEIGDDQMSDDLNAKATVFDAISCDFEELANRMERVKK